MNRIPLKIGKDRPAIQGPFIEAPEMRRQEIMPFI